MESTGAAPGGGDGQRPAAVAAQLEGAPCGLGQVCVLRTQVTRVRVSHTLDQPPSPGFDAALQLNRMQPLGKLGDTALCRLCNFLQIRISK